MNRRHFLRLAALAVSAAAAPLVRVEEAAAKDVQVVSEYRGIGDDELTQGDWKFVPDPLPSLAEIEKEYAQLEITKMPVRMIPGKIEPIEYPATWYDPLGQGGMDEKEALWKMVRDRTMEYKQLRGMVIRYRDSIQAAINARDYDGDDWSERIDETHLAFQEARDALWPAAGISDPVDPFDTIDQSG